MPVNYTESAENTARREGTQVLPQSNNQATDSNADAHKIARPVTVRRSAVRTPKAARISDAETQNAAVNQASDAVKFKYPSNAYGKTGTGSGVIYQPAEHHATVYSGETAVAQSVHQSHKVSPNYRYARDYNFQEIEQTPNFRPSRWVNKEKVNTAGGREPHRQGTRTHVRCEGEEGLRRAAVLDPAEGTRGRQEQPHRT